MKTTIYRILTKNGAQQTVKTTNIATRNMAIYMSVLALAFLLVILPRRTWLLFPEIKPAITQIFNMAVIKIVPKPSAE
jgi:hypothetical protein